MTKGIVFRSARIFDGESETLRSGVNVFVEGGVIREISDRPAGEEQEVVECGDRVLMPGLIDAHVHVYAAGLNIVRVAQSPMSYLAHFAAQFLHSSLDRGFTTLRDVGGADIGLVLAIKDGLLDRVPRLFYGGRVISQTGGHGDFRPGDHLLETGHFCGCSYHADQLAVIADGADAVRKAVREEFRRGASHIKIMASGGGVADGSVRPLPVLGRRDSRCGGGSRSRGSLCRCSLSSEGGGPPGGGPWGSVDRACDAD